MLEREPFERKRPERPVVPSALPALHAQQRRHSGRHDALLLARVVVLRARDVQQASISAVGAVGQREFAGRVERRRHALHEEAAARLPQVCADRLQGGTVEDDCPAARVVVLDRVPGGGPGVKDDNRRTLPSAGSKERLLQKASRVAGGRAERRARAAGGLTTS